MHYEPLVVFVKPAPSGEGIRDSLDLGFKEANFSRFLRRSLFGKSSLM